MKTLRDRFLAIDRILLDVDGVLTPGDITYGALSGEANTEIKRFHVRDGSGLKFWHSAGKRSGIITGRGSVLVSVRAEELGITNVIQRSPDKLAGLCEMYNLPLDALSEATLASICYVGDDVPDVAVMNLVGLAVAPSDACPDARKAAHYITRAAAGQGAVREIIERILRCQGLWTRGDLSPA
jgi:3-deoxy-D-manno-octulosonate 8-phosphate phosphatase (KDO 8-P phosphatase)